MGREKLGIKDLWEQIQDKKEMINVCVNKYGGTHLSKKNNWFSSMYNIPREYYEEVHEMLKRQIAKEKKRVSGS